jgi:hypothetical protein
MKVAAQQPGTSSQRYHQRCAQHDRCVEEVDILKSEMLRLCNGLEECTAALQAAMEELASSADGGGTPVTWLEQLNAGTVAALRAELLRLQINQTDAMASCTPNTDCNSSMRVVDGSSSAVLCHLWWCVSHYGTFSCEVT